MGLHSIASHPEPSIPLLPLSNHRRVPSDDMSEQRAADPLYRMRFASYIRSDRVDEVPGSFRNRTLAVRAFDARGLMLSWELVEGSCLEAVIGRLLADPKAQYLRIYYAALDRYAARVERK